MPDTNGKNNDAEDPKEPEEPKQWTLMFYFASDNPLGPSIVSQLKALKQAGFHPDANVVAYYDPPIPGTPTHIFEVNVTEKIRNGQKPKIGFTAKDSWIRNLVEDKLWGDQESIDGKKITELIKEALGDRGKAYNPPDPARQPTTKAKDPKRVADSNGTSDSNQALDSEGPEKSLGAFLKFCREKYPAWNYVLFILGHGLVVGNDVFLYDESSSTHSLSLTNLGKLLKDFKTRIKEDIGKKSEFHLVSFHSCSMSSLEVAYELKDSANYMLASQCPTSVGAWPYRQILMRVLNHISDQPMDIEGTIRTIFYYCLYNSLDFQLAGYSFDLCLCDLRNTAGVKEQLSKLSRQLIAAFAEGADPRAKDLILLAHWDAQSYWSEMYTDLYDFCFRLKRRCQDALGPEVPEDAISEDGLVFSPVEPAEGSLAAIKSACGYMIKALTPKSGDDSRQLIVAAEFVGPAYQYAHGLSVYFPWCEPFNSPFWMKQYATYQLIADEEASKGESEKDVEGVKENPSWRDFLVAYFEKTMRQTRHVEVRGDKDEDADDLTASRRADVSNPMTVAQLALEAMQFGIFANGELGNVGVSEFLGPGKVGGGDGTGDPGKVGGGDGTGGDYYFSTIKNYPPFTRRRPKEEPLAQGSDQIPSKELTA